MRALLSFQCPLSEPVACGGLPGAELNACALSPLLPSSPPPPAAALKGNEGLRSLELSYNPLGPEGAKAFADVIKYDMQPVSLGVERLKGWRAQSKAAA